MAYFCEISPRQSIYLDCQNGQTVVTLTSGGVGQQQQSSSRYPTGDWLSPPTIAQITNGAVITVVTSQGTTHIQIQGNTIALQSQSIAQSQATAHRSGKHLQLQPIEAASTDPASSMTPIPSMQPMQPMQPMTSMPPMKMGEMKMDDMSMQMNPMEMRMGNMEMRMGEANPSASAEGTRPQDVISPQTDTQSSETQANQPQSSPKFCPQCGIKVKVGDRFCSQCGHSLYA